ncbi:MAG: pyridoxal phosphate-dependent aminotransferase [Acidimicrobiales bacterium]|nr:pyridoxal phosphate-dependent aminotransferase [Acidimicrobiales bacterium]RZV48862.1 MAG: putative succinyldiaminopimelate transaminase DapC [Acidimicrobiales bacterium]
MVEALRNPRLQGFGTTIFAEMSALALRTESINLGQGFPDTDGPVEIADIAAECVRNGPNQYPPLPGQPDLRAAVAEHQQRFYGLSYDPDTEVLVTAGATEAIAASIIALCDHGDEVIVFEPTYDSYAATIAMAGATLVPVILEAPAYELDVDALRGAVTPNSRLLLLNTPHNPTGKVFSEEELRAIAAVAIEYDLVVVSDEVYEHMTFTGPHLPIASLPEMRERTITIGSAGKTFSFTGWKVGWITAPSELRAAAMTAKQFLTFVNAAPLQPAVAMGLRLPDAYFAGLRNELLAKRDRLSAGLLAAGFDVVPTQGTYFLSANITSFAAAHNLPATSIEFCLALPEAAGVVAVPSEVFYQTKEAGRSLIRFAFCKKDDVLDAAIERLSNVN